jgi:hypothetical protein
VNRTRKLCATSLALTAVSLASLMLGWSNSAWLPYASMLCAALSLITAVWAAVIEINREPSRLLLPIISLMASVLVVGTYVVLVLYLSGLGRMH